MRYITSLDQISEEMMNGEIEEICEKYYSFLNRQINSLYQTDVEDEVRNWKETPLGRALDCIFWVAKGQNHPEALHTFNYIEQITEAFFSLPVVNTIDIPDPFWNTPLGFSIKVILAGNRTAFEPISITDAADYLGLSKVYVIRIAEEKLGGKKISSGWVLNKFDVERYKAKREKGEIND